MLGKHRAFGYELERENRDATHLAVELRKRRDYWS
jgi:hypothetical protein